MVILLIPFLLAIHGPATGAGGEDPWVVMEGAEGLPGHGKHIVLLAGDEEYRSEEALPMLARILAARHGFRCTVLFAVDPETGTIDPDNQTHVPGMETLRTADLMLVFFRFRELPDEDMKHFVDYLDSGKPILGIRTSTHAFHYRRNPGSPYARYSFQNRDRSFLGGFGRQVLGETWIAHHGHHGQESTRGVIEEAHRDHPILRGVRDLWGPSDVYTVQNPLTDAKVLVRGQVVAGMSPENPPVEGPKNDPMMPLVWIREYRGDGGRSSRVLCSTLGAATDLECEGLRRLFVNACYWGLGMEQAIPEESNVDPVGDYRPTPFGFGKARKGVRPVEHSLEKVQDR